MTRVQYNTAVNDLLGLASLTTMGGMAPSDLLSPDSTGSMTQIAWDGYLKAAETIAAEVIANATMKAKFISCADATQATCLTDTIKTFGRKAFRRPLEDAEVTAFQAFNSLTPKGTSNEVAEAVLYAFLASPSFIMLPELSQDKDGSNLKLTSYEVAARLSFLLWNTIPDDALNMAADKNELQTKDQILTQAKRLLASPKTAGLATTFHRTYLSIEGSSHWSNNTHDAKFTNFTPSSYNDAMAEIDAYFQDVLASGGTFKDLFLSSNGFVTKDTAALYGLKASDYTTTLKKAPLDATKRPGFLTRVGFLSTFSHSDMSSPILRGAFISQRVLGIPTGDPDPKVLGAKPTGTFTTNRAGIESLTGASPCNTCHTATVNPPGFVLERFDAVGSWQDKDALGGDINSTADVRFNPDDNSTKTITSPAELMTEIAKAPSAQRSYALSFVKYATGRSDQNPADTCIVDQLSGNLKSNTSYTIANMMADYTQADSFRLRTVGN